MTKHSRVWHFPRVVIAVTLGLVVVVLSALLAAESNRDAPSRIGVDFVTPDGRIVWLSHHDGAWVALVTSPGIASPERKRGGRPMSGAPFWTNLPEESGRTYMQTVAFGWIMPLLTQDGRFRPIYALVPAFLYALVIYCVLHVGRVIGDSLDRRRKLSMQYWNSRCLHCAYDLAGLPAGTRCPECGED